MWHFTHMDEFMCVSVCVCVCVPHTFVHLQTRIQLQIHLHTEKNSRMFCSYRIAACFSYG